MCLPTFFELVGGASFLTPCVLIIRIIFSLQVLQENEPRRSWYFIFGNIVVSTLSYIAKKFYSKRFNFYVADPTYTTLTSLLPVPYCPYLSNSAHTCHIPAHTCPEPVTFPVTHCWCDCYDKFGYVYSFVMSNRVEMWTLIQW